MVLWPSPDPGPDPNLVNRPPAVRPAGRQEPKHATALVGTYRFRSRDRRRGGRDRAVAGGAAARNRYRHNGPGRRGGHPGGWVGSRNRGAARLADLADRASGPPAPGLRRTGGPVFAPPQRIRPGRARLCTGPRAAAGPRANPCRPRPGRGRSPRHCRHPRDPRAGPARKTPR